MSTAEQTVDIDREKRKMKALMRTQEQLLYVCFCVLLNLAHDEHVRAKMIKRGIVKYLGTCPRLPRVSLGRPFSHCLSFPTVPLLDRENPKLLLLVTSFLR